MIFGRTSNQLAQWQRHYALLPTGLSDGRIVWLEHFWERFRVNLAGFTYAEKALEPTADPPPPSGSAPLPRR